MQTPFEIKSESNVTIGTNGRIVVTTEDGFMRRRRALRVYPNNGSPVAIEMVYVEDPSGLRVYVQEMDDGKVIIAITKRDIYL